MRQVAIVITCDVCRLQGKEVTSIENHVFTIDNGRPRSLDLCEEHWESFEPLVKVIDMAGNPYSEAPDPPSQSQRPGPASRATTLVTPTVVDATKIEGQCPVCLNELSSRKNMVAHVRKSHPGYRVRRPQPELTPGAKSDPDHPLRCPECGYLSSRPQGLGAHRRIKHGVMGTSTYAVRLQKAADQPKLTG